MRVENEEDDHHRDGNNGGQNGLGDAVGDEVLDGFDVVNGSRDKAARALIVEEAVGQTLQMPIDAGHQVVHHPVGGYV